MRTEQMQAGTGASRERDGGGRRGDGAALVDALAELPSTAATRLDVGCAEATEAVGALRGLPSEVAPWAVRTAENLLAGVVGQPWHRAQVQLAALDRAIEHHRRAGTAVVRVSRLVDPGHAAGIYEQLTAGLAAGARMRRAFRTPQQRAVLGIGDAVTVDGRVPATAAAVEAAYHHLRFLEVVQRIDRSFRSVQMAVATDLERTAVLDGLLALREACAAVDRVVGAEFILTGLVSGLPADVRPVLHDVAAVERLAAAQSAAARRRAGQEAEFDTTPLPVPRPRSRPARVVESPGTDGGPRDAGGAT